ncbi:hypothetical protein [Spongorhabdus nitratireducens]
MLHVNLALFICLTLTGTLACEQDVISGAFSTWREVISLLPLGIMSGILLLLAGSFRIPLKQWQAYRPTAFAFRLTQPHVFFAAIGLTLMAGGLSGFVAAIAQGIEISKYSGMMFFGGFGLAIPPMLVCRFLSMNNRHGERLIAEVL